MIPQGYKHTELGIIPQEWEILPLSAAFYLQGGFAFKSELFSEGDGIPIVRISNLPIDGQYVNLSGCVYYPKYIDIQTQFVLQKKDLLIAMSGATTGKTAIYNECHEAYLNQRVGVFRQKSDKILYSYLTLIVNSRLFSDKLQPLLIAGAQPNIAPKDIEQMRYPVPPVEEQRKIAEILGVWDKAIELQARLIDKLELRKRALMQRLLSGRHRLPGFSAPWSKVRLGEILKTLSNGLVYNINTKGKFPVSRIETISNGEINYNKIGYAEESEQIESYRLNYGDILYSHINSLSNIGKVAYYDGKQLLYHGMNLLRFVADENKCYHKYLYYFLTSHKAKHIALILAKPAVNQASISISELSSVKLTMPNIAEQTAIAEVLSTADKEIEIAKSKLAAYRMQKRGLMQQLLTGKKRVNKI